MQLRLNKTDDFTQLLDICPSLAFPSFSFPSFSCLPFSFFLSFLPPPSLPPFLPLFLSLSYPKCLVGENTLMLTTLWAASFKILQKFHELYLYCLCTLDTNINTVKHINNASVFS